jgi:hypothetical protein
MPEHLSFCATLMTNYSEGAANWCRFILRSDEAMGRQSKPARRFFHTLLQQYVAYRRVNPALCKETLTFHDLLEVALPGDYELITNLIEGFHREEAAEKDLIDFCLSLPNRLLAEGRTVYPLIDCTKMGPFREDMVTGPTFAD